MQWDRIRSAYKILATFAFELLFDYFTYRLLPNSVSTFDDVSTCVSLSVSISLRGH